MVLSALLTTALACADTAATGKLDGGVSAADDATPAPVSVCPTPMPEPGTACTQPEGTTCVLTGCAEGLATCRGGVWARSIVAPEPFLCPEFLPKLGAECTKCWPTGLSCFYSCDGDAGTSPRQADCRDNGAAPSSWTLRDAVCPTTDASADARPDTGSDAGRDR
jgi:hypothetical protein